MTLAIYSLTCNGCMYVGSSVNVYGRIAHHKYLSKSSNSPVYKFIRSNGGWDKVEVNIHFYSTYLGKKDAVGMEEIFINVIKPSLNKNRVNIMLPKKDYDKQRYRDLKTIVCPCCNKIMTKYNLKNHKKTKRYNAYKSSIAVF